MSLKEILKTHISQRNGETVSFEEIETICKREGRRTSNGERRLREIPEVEAVKSKKGHITGYRWFKKSYPWQPKLF